MRKILKLSLGLLIFFFAWNFVSLGVSAQDNSSHTQLISVESPRAIIAQAYNPGDVSFLTSMLNGENLGNTAWLKGLYSFTRGLLNLALLAFLIYVAFRNILNLGVDNYGVKKILPKLVVAAFFGNLILPIMAVASRVVDSLQIVSVFQPRVFDWMSIIGKMPAITGPVGTIGGLLLVLIAPAAGAVVVAFGLLAFLILGILLVMCLLMSLFLALRPWIIMLGAAVGPVAIACYVLPETETVFKRWLKIIGFWMVYPLIIYSITYIATIVPSMMGAVDDGAVSSIIGFAFPIVIKIILFFLVVRAPFNWEKDIGGFIQNLPQTVAKGAQTVDRVSRGVYGAAGVRAYNTMVKWNQDAGDRNIKKRTANGDLGREVNTHMASVAPGGGQEGTKQRIAELMRTGIGEDKTTMGQLKGQKLPTFDQMLTKWNEYDSTGTIAEADDAPILAYFKAHEAPIEAQAYDLEKSQKSAEIRMDYGKEGQKKFFESKTRAALMLPQRFVPSGLSTYFKALNEGYATDMRKMEMRFNEPVQALAKMTGGEAYLKEHKARKQGDHSPLDEEGLRNDVGTKDWDMAMVKGKLLGIDITKHDGQMQALAYHQAQQKKYFDAQETGAVYVRQWLGRSAIIKDQNGDDKPVTIDADMLATNISAYEKQRTLAASAARSSVAVEQQKFLRQSQQDKFWLMRRGAPSASITPQDTRTQQPISPAERKIIQGLDGIRKDIKGTSGIQALNRLNSSFTGASFDDLKPEEYVNFYFGAKGDQSTLNDRLIEKAGDDPGKRDQVQEFMNSLEASRGLEPKIMVERAEQEFGHDPEVERLVTEYSAKAQMDLVITQKNPEARALQQKAASFAARGARDSRIIVETKKSIDIFYKQLAGNSSVTPDQAKKAKDYIASQVGISDGNAVSKTMVQGLSQQVNLVSIRNPEIE